ncbi:MAG: CoA transferase [Oscillospiraceae bacterium]|nr:CoA transferase [Oscillospiraceae bacterium]
MENLFTGIKVIDITNNLAGPLCAQMLGDYGADVIKIERPGAGDDARGLSPKVGGQALFYLYTGRNKKSVTLALDDPRAQECIYKMVKDADVFIESYKPGQMKKFNLDYETISKINPNIIYCSVSVAGQVGQFSKVPGFDIIAQAMSGLMAITGDPNGIPVKSGTVLGDYIGGMNAFSSIVSALLYRTRTGEGQYIDVSLLAGLVGINTLLDRAATVGDHPTRTGPHHGACAPYGLYNGKDGESCIIAAYTGGMWPRFCNCMGKPELIDDPRFDSNVTRCRNIKELVAIVEEWLRTFDTIDDAIAVMKASNIATSKVNTCDDVVNDPEYRNLGLIIDIPTPPSMADTGIDHVTVRGNWLRFSKCQPVYNRPSDLGEYNDEILTKYMDKAELDQCLVDWAGKFKKQ